MFRKRLNLKPNEFYKIEKEDLDQGESEDEGDIDEGDDGDDESDNIENRYKVKSLKSNKDKIKQPRCCEVGVLPKIPFGMLVVGVTGSGKSVATISMLTNKYMLKNAFDFIVMWCGVKPDDNFVKELGIDKENIKVDFTEEDVESYCTKLEKASSKNGKDFSKLPNCLFIFDDILNKPKFMKSKTMSKIATAHRHMNLSYILLSQYYKKVCPVVRTNVHGLMFLPSNQNECIKFSEENCPANMSQKEFLSIIQHCTKDQFSFMFVNKKAKNGEKIRHNFDKIVNTN